MLKFDSLPSIANPLTNPNRKRANKVVIPMIFQKSPNNNSSMPVSPCVENEESLDKENAAPSNKAYNSASRQLFKQAGSNHLTASIENKANCTETTEQVSIENSTLEADNGSNRQPLVSLHTTPIKYEQDSFIIERSPIQITPQKHQYTTHISISVKPRLSPSKTLYHQNTNQRLFHHSRHAKRPVISLFNRLDDSEKPLRTARTLKKAIKSAVLAAMILAIAAMATPWLAPTSIDNVPQPIVLALPMHVYPTCDTPHDQFLDTCPIYGYMFKEKPILPSAYTSLLEPTSRFDSNCDIESEDECDNRDDDESKEAEVMESYLEMLSY